MLDTGMLLRATAANHRSWFRRTAALAGGGVERLHGIDVVVAGGHGTIGFPRGRARTREALDDAMGLGLRSMSCWALDDDLALGALLLARGFECGWQPHWMALELARLPDEEPAHPVVAAHAEEGRDLPYAHVGPDPRSARHLAVVEDGRTVGHVVVNPWRGHAGIYDMGVVHDRRRRGIGRALTIAACRLGRELGCASALLNATGEGEALYRTVGFESLGLGRTWWQHPGRRPTARQTALAEAIGLGDVDALAALRPTRAELERALPGAGTPLDIAATCEQRTAAEWIERRLAG